MKILYVENHAVFAAQVTAQFLPAHEVIVVPSLSQARQALSSGAFDLVLIDYDLDDGKRAELAREIRKFYPTLKIIGVSAHDAGNQALLKVGADAVCGKMDFDKIGSIIEAVMSQPG